MYMYAPYPILLFISFRQSTCSSLPVKIAIVRSVCVQTVIATPRRLILVTIRCLIGTTAF